MSETGKSFLASGKLWALVILVTIGLLLGIWQPIERAALLDFGYQVGTSWWFLLLTMIAIAVLFTFGLPGSLGLWLIAPFNHPVISTTLLVVASTVGALGAYRFADRMGDEWRQGTASTRIIEILRKRGDLFTLLAMRMLPGFPHSVINFASGVVGLSVKTFAAATILGLIIKWGVYTATIYGITDAIEGEDPIDLNSLLPLFVLVALALIGAWFRRRME